MANVILMAKAYQTRPSKIMGISDDYAAYCFDEAALFMLAEATGKDGELNWNKFRWRGDKKGGNEDFMQFVKGRLG